MTRRAVSGCPSQLICACVRFMLISASLTKPSVANIVRKTSEYDTKDTAHGRKIAVRQSVLKRRSLALRRLARISARTSMIGTWMTR